MRTNWRQIVIGVRKATGSNRPVQLREAPHTGSGKAKRSRVTGSHKFMSRTDREALCRKLEGG